MFRTALKIADSTLSDGFSRSMEDCLELLMSADLAIVDLLHLELAIGSLICKYRYHCSDQKSLHFENLRDLSGRLVD